MNYLMTEIDNIFDTIRGISNSQKPLDAFIDSVVSRINAKKIQGFSLQ